VNIEPILACEICGKTRKAIFGNNIADERLIKLKVLKILAWALG